MNDSRAPHGSHSRYQAGCRCADCRDANTQVYRLQRKSRRERGLPPGDPRHGTFNAANNWGCLCPDCREAVKKRNDEYYAAHRKEPVLRPWTEDEIISALQLPAAEAARITGRSLSAVYSIRFRVKKLGVAS